MKEPRCERTRAESGKGRPGAPEGVVADAGVPRREG
ncbi:hypothetical protein Mx4_p16 [Myxococcus phage Mx4]|nr:hypothetical protein Mx4_p16 [Myxococcus phage Mx4]